MNAYNVAAVFTKSNEKRRRSSKKWGSMQAIQRAHLRMGNIRSHKSENEKWTHRIIILAQWLPAIANCLLTSCLMGIVFSTKESPFEKNWNLEPSIFKYLSTNINHVSTFSLFSVVFFLLFFRSLYLLELLLKIHKQISWTTKDNL